MQSTLAMKSIQLDMIYISKDAPSLYDVYIVSKLVRWSLDSVRLVCSAVMLTSAAG